MRKPIAILLLVLLLPTLIACSSQDPNAVVATKLLDYHTEKYDDMPATGELIDGVRVIEINAYQFYFEPEVIIVNQGEKVKVIVNAVDVPHGFEIEGYEIPGYDINTLIRPGIPLELEFTADRKGVWEFICTIYCGFGHSTMSGTWVIR